MTRRATSGTLLALASAVVTGCGGPSSSQAVHAEAGDGLDGTGADAVVGDASEGEGTPNSGDDGDSDGDAEVARCGSAIDGGQDGSTSVVCSTEACLDSNWAQWPMPNGPADVANGAPNLETYTVNGDGTVTDDLTGLTWQQMPPTSGYTWADAQTYCNNLALATHSDWRLPTFIELVSIIDYSQNAPAISPTAFPPASVDFWSSTPFAGALTDAREVYFSSGDTGHDGVFGTNYVRCARGPAGTPSPAIPPARYAIGGSGTVYDNKTGLTWQQTVSSQTFAWADAKAYCANLADGWRLPTAKELLTLVEVARSSIPTIDCDAFPDAPAEDEWSATPFSGFSGSSPSVWAVSFYAGNPISRAVSSLNFVRCVR